MRMFQYGNNILFDLHKIVLVDTKSGTVYLPGQTLRLNPGELVGLLQVLRKEGGLDDGGNTES